MPKPRSHYDVLGIKKETAPEEVKSRYREMARTYHPDVRKDHSPEANRFFSEIIEAYRVLSDPLRRSEYDRQLDAEAAASRPAEQSRPQDGPRTEGATSPRAGSAGPSARRPTYRQARPAADINKLLSDAEMSFIRGRLKEAESLAHQALRLDRRNARAYGVMGDIHRALGQIDQAVSDYTYAVQLDPHNLDYQRKLDRLAQKNRYRASNSTSSERNLTGEREPGLGLVINSVGWAVVFALVLLTARPSQNAPTFSFGPAHGWTYQFLGMAIAASLIAGFLLASGRFVRPLDDVLVFSSGGSGAMAVPAGLALIVISVVLFYAALVVFILISVAQQHFSRSLSTVFSIAFILVLGLTIAYSPGNEQEVLVWGGNIVFPSMIVGWFLGDFFRGWW
ncbi:MAG: DnaJ domain-containing protein [Armatimonadetes bacterium]|nr:DnaJ domain-containing protein [Armatimonadota bacterium]